VVLNGVDTERFRPSTENVENARQRIFGMTGRPLLCTVGRLVAGKGISVLLEALELIRREAPNAALVIAGDGPRRKDLQRTAEQLGLTHRVRFLGNRDDVERIYPLCDIYVQPSHAEGISLTILEACSCGLPVVATAVGGNPEVIEDGRTGMLVPADDAQSLAEAVLRLWRRPARARRMGRAARRRVRNEFSVERMVEQYMDLYREIGRRKAADARS
jgi:glycosyltransferase involved in cell wall biosynthesis